MWVRTDPWDRAAAWGEHGAPVDPGVFEPWMRYRATSTAVFTPTATSTPIALSTATTTGIALASPTTTAVP